MSAGVESSDCLYDFVAEEQCTCMLVIIIIIINVSFITQYILNNTSFV